jgi:hypothetical protein
MQERQIPNEIVEMILKNYEDKNSETMGNLHNRFVGFISEAKLPITHVITVLQLLLTEAVEMANQKFIGGD